MNIDDANPEQAGTETAGRSGKVAFGLRVAALAGVAVVIGAGIATADLNTAAGAMSSTNTTCCIIAPPQ